MFDSDKDDYLNAREFITGLLRIYCSTLEQKARFIFEIYDFDNDGLISRDDISSILSYMPVGND